MDVPLHFISDRLCVCFAARPEELGVLAARAEAQAVCGGVGHAPLPPQDRLPCFWEREDRDACVAIYSFVVRKLHLEHKRVLLCCRTVTPIVFYLINYYGVTTPEAVEYLRNPERVPLSLGVAEPHFDDSHIDDFLARHRYDAMEPLSERPLPHDCPLSSSLDNIK